MWSPMCAPFNRPNSQRRVVISFHDVTPSSQPVYDAFYQELCELGYARVSLLVVPRWHGAEPITKEPAFCRWLHQLEDCGCEICLHGWTHTCDTAPTRPLSRFMRHLYTDNESEFFDLSPELACARIQRGLSCLHECGFHPNGFVAPAWLYGKNLHQMLPELGLTYTTCLRHIQPLGAPRLYAPTLTLSHRSAWRRIAAVHWARYWPRLHRRTPMVRLAIHPGDLHYKNLHDHLMQALHELSMDRTAITYQTLLQERSTPS